MLYIYIHRIDCFNRYNNDCRPSENLDKVLGIILLSRDENQV